MISGLEESERCAMCGRDEAVHPAYCHFYQRDQRIALCSPECAERFLFNAANHDGPPHDFLKRYLETLEWKSEVQSPNETVAFSRE